jgi:hypothetical protein
MIDITIDPHQAEAGLAVITRGRRISREPAKLTFLLLVGPSQMGKECSGTRPTFGMTSRPASGLLVSCGGVASSKTPPPDRRYRGEGLPESIRGYLQKNQDPTHGTSQRLRPQAEHLSELLGRQPAIVNQRVKPSDSHS